MGYRSDMKIVVYLANPRVSRAEWFVALPLAGLKLWFDENYPLKDALEEWGAEVEYGYDSICVSYEDVKWYDNYDHVKAVKAALATFDEAFETGYERARAHWEFVRIGEETDDIKIDGSPYSDGRLRISRQIIFEQEGR